MKRSGMTLGDLLTYAALALALVVFLAPVLWMLITAVKPPGEWLTTPPILIPSETPLGELHRRALQVGRPQGTWRQPDRGVAFDRALAALRRPGRLRARAFQHRRRESVLHRAEHPVHAAGRGRHSDVHFLVVARPARQLHRPDPAVYGVQPSLHQLGAEELLRGHPSGHGGIRRWSTARRAGARSGRSPCRLRAPPCSRWACSPSSSPGTSSSSPSSSPAPT